MSYGFYILVSLLIIVVIRGITLELRVRGFDRQQKLTKRSHDQKVNNLTAEYSKKATDRLSLKNEKIIYLLVYIGNLILKDLAKFDYSGAYELDPVNRTLSIRLILCDSNVSDDSITAYRKVLDEQLTNIAKRSGLRVKKVLVILDLPKGGKKKDGK